MKSILTATSVALALAVVPVHAAQAEEELVIVDVSPVATDLAAHLKVDVARVPVTVDLPSKTAAVVCESTLKQLRDGGGRCVAVGMSQGLIQAVRSAMRSG